MFTDGPIHDVIVKEFKYYTDKRGWLTELFRVDELPEGFFLKPQMAYISMTKPAVARGPHVHAKQYDYFCFLSDFTLYLWDMRPNSQTYKNRYVLRSTKDKIVIVPPGVVHAYKNSSEAQGMVINIPDTLYAGWGKTEPVDETRYEDIPESPFILD